MAAAARPWGHQLQAEAFNEIVHLDFLYMGSSTTGQKYILAIKDGLCQLAMLFATFDSTALTATLATAPVRDIVVTGANSGVGLAGAKLLTAAGHRVVCACRTEAKAAAAAEACAAYARSSTVRAGGTARGASAAPSVAGSGRQWQAAAG